MSKPSNDNELKNKLEKYLVGKDAVPLAIIGQIFPRAKNCNQALSRVLGKDGRFSLGPNNNTVSLSRRQNSSTEEQPLPEGWTQHWSNTWEVEYPFDNDSISKEFFNFPLSVN
jgi:hypothetical protein